MEKSYFLSKTFNNIVFRGRNQEYGAYMLRRAYSKHMLLASTLATAIFSAALVGPLVDTIFIADPVKYVKPTYTILEPYVIELPQLPTPKPTKAITPPPAPAAEKQVKTEKYTDIRVVDDATAVTETVPDQQDLAEVNIGAAKIEGDMPTVPGMSLSEVPPTGIEGGIGEELPTAESEAYISVEQMPKFKGGVEALAAYLGRKLRYPEAAQSRGVEGMVVVTFVVGVNGEITNVEVLKGVGYGTEEEASRVIRDMPRWEPGRQNGRAVPVRYTLPIRFSIK